MSMEEVKRMFSPVIHHENGVYWAEIPAMPGCLTVADTIDELGPNLLEAISCWILTSAEVKQLKENHRSSACEKVLA